MKKILPSLFFAFVLNIICGNDRFVDQVIGRKHHGVKISTPASKITIFSYQWYSILMIRVYSRINYLLWPERQDQPVGQIFFSVISGIMAVKCFVAHSLSIFPELQINSVVAVYM